MDLIGFRPFLKTIFFLNLILGMAPGLAAQTKIKGRVLSFKNGKPIPVGYASIAILKKTSGLLTDAAGNFNFSLTDIKKSDTLMISSIGYSSLRMPVKEAMDQSEFILSEFSKELDNVVIKTYLNESSEGARNEVAGYFRSWPTKSTGGEIGRIIYINHDEYKVEKIRFKVNNQCDTCLIRVRIKDLKNGLPDMDLLHDSISMVVKRLTFDDKYSEFDFSKYNLILKKKYVFIGLEVLNCTNNGQACSLCFIGTEPGNYLFRKKDYAEWEETADHSIYLKMFYKY